MIGCSGCIETYKDTARYNLIDTKYRQMVLRSIPTSNILEPLVKQKWVVTTRGRQPIKFVAAKLDELSKHYQEISTLH